MKKKHVKIVAGLGLVFIVVLYLLPSPDAWMNLGYANVSAVFYDEDGNEISDIPFFELRTIEGEKIAGLGIKAQIHFVEKQINTVGSAAGQFELLIRWASYTDQFGVFQNHSLTNPFNWVSTAEDWSDKINIAFEYESGQLFTWQQLEQEILETVGAFYQGRAGINLDGTTFTVGMTIRLHIDSKSIDGQPFPRASAWARGHIQLVYNQFEDPNELGVIITQFDLSGFIGGSGNYDDGGGSDGVDPAPCNPLISNCPVDIRG